MKLSQSLPEIFEYSDSPPLCVRSWISTCIRGSNWRTFGKSVNVYLQRFVLSNTASLRPYEPKFTIEDLAITIYQSEKTPSPECLSSWDISKKGEVGVRIEVVFQMFCNRRWWESGIMKMKMGEERLKYRGEIGWSNQRISTWIEEQCKQVLLHRHDFCETCILSRFQVSIICHCVNVCKAFLTPSHM